MIEGPRLGVAAAILGLALAGCGDATGTFIGQVRVRPVFTAGDAPGDLGVRVDSTNVEIRDEISGALRVDTVMAYDEAASLSWVMQLESEDEPVTVRLRLLGLSDTLYAGDRELTVRHGSVGSAALQDVEVAFQGASAERVEVTPGSAVLERPGSTARFQATVYDGDGNPISGRITTWTSSAATVATVDDGGLTTGVGNGTALIIASVGGLADTATVTAYAIDSVVVRPADATLTAIGATAQLTATAYDARGNAVPGVAFDWSTSDAAVAPVDGSGRVTATDVGAVEIVAAAGGAADTARVTVTQSVERVEVTPAQTTLTAVGATVQLVAVAYDASGNPVPGVGFAWAASDPGVASVDADGLVTAIGPGTVSVAATSGARADTVAVTVMQGVDHVVVTPDDTLLLGAGAKVRLSATAFDARSNPIAGASFTWSSTHATVADVDATGEVTAVDAGTVRVVAASGGRADTAAITVAVRDSVTYAVDSVEVAIGQDLSERSLGGFVVPNHVAALGVVVSAEVELSFDEELDEAFALGVQESGGPRFLGGSCPVVGDDPSLGIGWLNVATADLAPGTQEFVARHATRFACYTVNGALLGKQSVVFLGIRLVYWRTR